MAAAAQIAATGAVGRVSPYDPKAQVGRAAVRQRTEVVTGSKEWGHRQKREGVTGRRAQSTSSRRAGPPPHLAHCWRTFTTLPPAVRH